MRNTPAATASVCSPTSHPPIPRVCVWTGECAHPPESVGTHQRVSATHLRESSDHRHQLGECAQRPGSVPRDWGLSTSTGECPHLISEGAETTGTNQGVCPVTGECVQSRELCISSWECPHLITEGTETTGTRESANQGSVYAHTQAQKRLTIKKSG